MTANLNHMAEVAERIAAGDLRVEVCERSPRRARAVLQKIGRAPVPDPPGADPQRQRELGSAAAELVATSTQQSASTPQQTISLQEMSTTLDQLRVIVH